MCKFFNLVVHFLNLAFAVNSQWTQSSNSNWPSYINKCVADSPDLSRCMTDYANYALPFIFPGDPDAGFVQLVPFTFEGLPGLNFGSNGTFQLELKFPKLYGLNHFYVHNMTWDFKNKHIEIQFKYENALRLMATYKSYGKFLNATFNGSGYTDIIFLNGNVTYRTMYRPLTIDNKEYIQIYNSSLDTQEYMRVLFESPAVNLQEEVDLNTYLNKNSQVFHQMIAKEWNQNLYDIIDGTLEPMFFNFALSEIFN